jgi:hypothetical protein
MPVDTQLKNKISNAKTLGDIFRELDNHYDLDKVQLGFFAKNILIQKIDGIVDFLKVPKKNGSIKSH